MYSSQNIQKKKLRIGLFERALQMSQKAAIIVGFCVTLYPAFVAVSSEAHARYSFIDALKTVGIATGIGTVLGLSTLPFYDAPFSHFSNVVIGGGAGLIAGIGIASYYLSGTYFGNDDEIDPEELLVPKAPSGSEKPANENEKPKSGAQLYRARSLTSVPATNTNSAQTIAQNYRVNQWVLGVRLLELRF